MNVLVVKLEIWGPFAQCYALNAVVMTCGYLMDWQSFTSLIPTMSASLTALWRCELLATLFGDSLYIP